MSCLRSKLNSSSMAAILLPPPAVVITHYCNQIYGKVFVEPMIHFSSLINRCQCHFLPSNSQQHQGSIRRARTQNNKHLQSPRTKKPAQESERTKKHTNQLQSAEKNKRNSSYVEKIQSFFLSSSYPRERRQLVLSFLLPWCFLLFCSIEFIPNIFFIDVESASNLVE